MNLIEQLGGYDKAKEWVNPSIEAISQEVLKSELLEYRRQHNIYEVGDLITHPAYDWKILKVHDPIPSENTLFAFTNDHVKHHWGHGIVFEKNGVVMVTYNYCRHATDAEIAAGKRS